MRKHHPGSIVFGIPWSCLKSVPPPP
jgi:hypothetical protein